MFDEFRLDEKNELLKNQYENNNNYFVQAVGKSDICYIFCSSNGIYYPNTTETFIKTIVEGDRYEWGKISNSDEVQEAAGKIIYVRDIYKQYYVRGINGTIDSIEKLCELLKELGSGMKIRTCGISSGGYLATILGVYLQAECVYTFGGQWSLFEGLQDAEERGQLEKSYYFLHKYRSVEKYKRFYEITGLLKNNKVPIMYFYSAQNEEDKVQAQLLKEAKPSCVYCFAMKSSEHGYTMFNGCYKKVLTCSVEKLKQIHFKYENHLISLRKICFDFMDMDIAIRECVNDIIQSHKSLQQVAQFFRKSAII